MEFLDNTPEAERAEKMRETHVKAVDMLERAILDGREYILLVKQDKEPQGPIVVGGGAAIIHIANMREVLDRIVRENTQNPMEKAIRILFSDSLLKMPLKEFIASLGLSEEDIAMADAETQAEGGKSLAELFEMEKNIKQRMKDHNIDPKAMGLSAQWKED